MIKSHVFTYTNSTYYRGPNARHIFDLLAQFKRGDCDGIKVSAKFEPPIYFIANYSSEYSQRICDKCPFLFSRLESVDFKNLFHLLVLNI